MARQYGQNTTSSDQARAIVANDLQNQAARSHKLEMGIAAAFIAVGIISIGASVVSSANYNEKLEETQKLIQEEKINMTNKENESANYKVEKNANLVSAGGKGQAICNLQNSMIKCIADENERAKSGELGLTEEHMIALQNMKKELDDSNRASMFRSWSKYGEWTFKSNYTFVGDTRDCVWACYMPDDANRTKPLVFVTGKYNSKTNNFTGLRKIYTRYYYEVDKMAKYHMDEYDTENDTPDSELPVETEMVLPEEEEPIVTTVPFSEEEPIVTTVPSLALPYIETTSVTTEAPREEPAATSTTTSAPATETSKVTELEFYYSWSSAYGCWGYFDSNGNFYTEEEYEGMVY